MHDTRVSIYIHISSQETLLILGNYAQYEGISETGEGHLPKPLMKMMKNLCLSERRPWNFKFSYWIRVFGSKRGERNGESFKLNTS